MLIALTIEGHVHHNAAEVWFGSMGSRFATCAFTQGALLRLVVRRGASFETAHGLLTSVLTNQHHEFWSDDISYREVPIAGIIGHRQVTDAYLAQLCRRRHGRLATFDRGLAALHSDVAELVPAGAL